MKKYIAETIGTFLLVFLGTLTITQSSGNLLIIAAGFGITLFIVIALFGSVSGAHVNPAVSLGAWVRGSFSMHDLVPYWIAQFLGAICGSIFVYNIVGRGTSIGETMFHSIDPLIAFLIEALLTFIFVFVILQVAEKKPKNAGLVIGGTLFIIHLAAVPLTGASVNPARSLAPVVVVANAKAASQVWVYIVGPLCGAILAGMAVKKLGKNVR